MTSKENINETPQMNKINRVFAELRVIVNENIIDLDLVDENRD